MKHLAISLFAVCISAFGAFAQASSTNASAGISTIGEAQLPPVLKLVVADGSVSEFTTTKLKSAFYMKDDNTLMMNSGGLSSKCGGLLGKTSEDLSVPLHISKRVITGQYLGNDKWQETPAGQIGQATLLIPSGANVWGGCGAGGNEITDMALEYSVPTNSANLFDQPWAIIYKP